MIVVYHENRKVIQLYWDDLSSSAKERLLELLGDNCKYRLDQTICTVKTCHLNGQNRPRSRSTIPHYFCNNPRRDFSTALAACRL